MSVSGITITAAAVSFPWGDHLVNVIDTPGHIDFTMEVEQTLNAMDGAVVILDGSAGMAVLAGLNDRVESWILTELSVLYMRDRVESTAPKARQHNR